VVTGAGKAFSGGADIREFNTPKALAEPTLRTLIAIAEGEREAHRRRDLTACAWVAGSSSRWDAMAASPPQRASDRRCRR
jgi:enoyl-CoA hydratase/carnithine racemase